MTPLTKLLAVLRQHKGNQKELLAAVAAAFFKDSKTPNAMARNTLIALKFHGIVDEHAEPTDFGKQLLAVKKEKDAHAALAKNILLNLGGIHLVQTLREMRTGDIKPTLGSITDELKKRGLDASDNSSDLSGVLGWLREAGVLNEYVVNEEQLAALVGTSPKTLDALKDLNAAQIAFLRAMVSLSVEDWTPHNKIVQHAEQLYAGQVTYNWKDIDRSILQPLLKGDLIEIRKATKKTGDSRGGKAADVRPTEKFRKEVSDPILIPLYSAAGSKDIAKIRSYPLAQLVADIRQKKDDNLRGQALEILAIRICQLLDLEFGGLRETDEDIVGGGEVDAFMHSSRLVYSRWQIQCKAADKITYETIAKEVGVSEISLANVIMIVSTGKLTDGAATYRQKMVSKSALNIIVVDGQALDTIVNDPATIVSILKAQADDAMRMKPLPQALPIKGGGGGTDEGPKIPPFARVIDKSKPADDSPTLFKPAYTTPAGGEMYLGDSYDVLRHLIAKGVRVKLIVTSPPFALIRKKEYGNEAQEAYVAWFMRFAPLFQQILEPSGSFVMDIGGSWIPGIPARSVYQYRLLLRLCESGFYLAQEFYHYNPARLPTPAEWVTIRRLRVKDAVNNVWWFVRDPFADADNRRVLVEYSDAMKSLLKNGYKAAMRPSGHDISGKFSIDNKGAIPPNLLTLANTESNSYYLRACRAANIKPHPARFPVALPSFFIKMLTKPGDLVLDPFAGSAVTGEAAEKLGRRWIGCELDPTYVIGSRFRFDRSRDEEGPSAKTRARKKKRDDESLFLLKQIADAERQVLAASIQSPQPWQ